MSDGKRAVDSDKVWTTLITNLDYLPGLLTLDFSLKRVKSAYPLVALYTDTFPDEGRRALAARGIAAQRIAYLLPSKSTRDYSADPRFYDCWSKLTPFGLTQYARVVQLDSDMLVLRNMDELMELELDAPAVVAAAEAAEDEAAAAAISRRVFAAGHACLCNPLGKKHYPADWVPANCAFTLQHGDPERYQVEGADPAGDGSGGGGGDAQATLPVGLELVNGGLQVVNPSRVLFERIVAYMDSHAAELDFADQSLLSTLFRGRWVALPYVYNALKTLRWPGVHDALWRDDRVKNIHYILTPNPWDELGPDGELNAAAAAAAASAKPGSREAVNAETHGWWATANRERKEAEEAQGITDSW